MSGRPSIIFDLDGTLVETAEDIVTALNVSVAPAGIAPLPVGLVRTMIGAGARRLIQRAFDHAGFPAPDAAVDAAGSQDEVVLWFEADLYDQAILLHLLPRLF